ncbi:ABC transporter substrate-binding protein [Desulfolucanica intricata]|uniref:ABC transporter substrate-binding protein n=1 Tax=Desulfolucanica intricata TaxID=1285191 RepID=UPI000837A2E8|nr:ABC transporter substrate-binding protein [Desulfolucanica intricata]
MLKKKMNTWQPPKKNQRYSLIMWALIICGLALFYINHGAASLPALIPFKSHDTVYYAYADEAQTLDPALAKDPQSAKVISCIFEGLVRYKPGTSEIEPALATGWEISPDGLEYTFTLRKNVNFHDNTPFNAQAVKYSIERLFADNRQNYHSSLIYKYLKEVQVIDNYTVKLILNRPYAPLLRNLAMPYSAPIVSPSAARKYGSTFGINPVGTGPYLFKEWDKGNTITLSANPYYWDQGPKIKELVFLVIPRAGDRMAGLINGNIHLADGFTPQHLDMMKQKEINVLTAVGADISYLGFFVNKKPFNNAKIRQAVSSALNRRNLVENGHPDIPLAQGLLPQGILSSQEYLTPISYNPAKAKELLREAGYKEGIEIDLITYEETRTYNTTGGNVLAQSIQKELAQVNIQVNIKTYPWDEYKKALHNQEGNAFIYGWISDSGDPDDFLYYQFNGKQNRNGLNICRYNNPQVNVLLEQARQCTDPKLREQFYCRIQQILLKDSPWVPLNHSLHVVGISPSVKGCILQSNGIPFLNHLH